MSAAIGEHTRPADGNPSPQADNLLSSDQQAPSRFTAVNGHSPSNSEERIQYSEDSGLNQKSGDSRNSRDSNMTSAHLQDGSPRSQQRRGSQSSTGKRKHASSGEDSPVSDASHLSHKKRRARSDERQLLNGGSEYESAHYPHHHRNNDHADERSWHGSRHQRDGSSASDARLAEVLQQESHQIGPFNNASPTVPSASTSPEQRYPLTTPVRHPQHPSSSNLPATAGASATNPNTPMSANASGQKPARKRVFSNRTKTGCMTCRERKKKCDEGKPICNNCDRGGFVCKGYTQANSLYKSGSREAPPIQAKNGMYDPIPANFYPSGPPPGLQPSSRPEYYEHHGPPPQQQQHSASAHHPLPPASGPARAVEGMPHRSLPGEDERSQHWSEQQQQQQHHPGGAAPYPLDSLPQYGEGVPPMAELSRHNKKLPPPNAVLAHSSHHRTASQPTRFSNTQMTAQLALDASRGPSHAPPYRPIEEQFRTEKEKMLNGVPYQPRDPQLKKDRQECASAVCRFNRNAIDPNNLSESQRREQFRQILEPHNAKASSETDGVAANGSSSNSGTSKGGASANSVPVPNNSMNGKPNRSGSPESLSRPVGQLGANVEVEAPFYCDYGYNIRIGDDVDIGMNCRVMDSCTVEIGARSTIGPDVKILTTDGDHSSKRAPGQKRLLRGEKIVIGEDVFIGAGAIILGGVTIASGAIIGAGTLVKQDIGGPLTVCNNSRLRFLRGAYETSSYAEGLSRY